MAANHLDELNDIVRSENGVNDIVKKRIFRAVVCRLCRRNRIEPSAIDYDRIDDDFYDGKHPAQSAARFTRLVDSRVGEDTSPQFGGG